MRDADIRNKLVGKKLKVTPQRLAVFAAVEQLHNHPTVENIVDFIRKNHPNIAIGTVYKVLDTLVDKRLIRKVYTEDDVARYDAVTETHHHLYCHESNRIEDFMDDNLNQVLADYFKRKKIPGFTVDEIKLQITGKFLKDKKF
jgi:Fur family peroxide stress response transcriptional regulator